MSDYEFNFTKPEGWRVIKPERYRDFSILSTKEIPCIYGFAIERKQGGYDIVSMFDYGESSAEFINELNAELDKLEKNNKDVNKVNDYIKENAADYAVTETSSMKPIFHKTAKIYGRTAFVNIMEIETNVGKSYSVQIFIKVKKNLVCFGTSVQDLDKKSPFESAVKQNKFLSDLINVMIQSIA